jgi:hypothetical protein
MIPEFPLYPRRFIAILVASFLCAATTSNAIILLRTGDPTANTTAPTGSLAGSGWDYEGTFGGFLGTAIAPHFFITAQHVGLQSNTFFYRGLNYTITQSFPDPNSDLRIFKVAEAFPAYAPLYLGNNEIGHHLVVFGRGTQRGGDVLFEGNLRGWFWGGSDSVVRWGENEVASTAFFGGLGDMLYALFDGNAYTEEAHLSSGDSGGAVFLDDGGVWKLGGINYGVDGPFSSEPGGDNFIAALFDMRGFYGINGVLIDGPVPVPSGFYASRISSNLTWIQSIIGPGVVNISTRALVGTEDRVCIAGFIIGGDPSKTKRVMIRGLGPSLRAGSVPLPGRLLDPTLELHNSAGALIFSNNDWHSSQQAAIQQSGLAPANDKESALIATLVPGTYTAILGGANSTTGIALVEVYDLDANFDPSLNNISTRADVGAGDGVLIGGLIVRSAKSLLLRALGPTLSRVGVVGELQDPAMELHDSNGALLIGNDNWIDAANRIDIEATGLAPTDDREPAILFAPTPGNYTAIVKGAGSSTGIALMEAYVLAQ